MEKILYDHMAELDELHWWYRGRRAILADLIRRERPPARSAILELGCGTGHNFPMLGEFGHVEGLELDAGARAIAEKRLGRKLMSAPLPELEGVPEKEYDLIGAFDVIEHVEDDRAAIASIAKRLRTGGKLVLTVPAHQWMWSAHDDANMHMRRYSKRVLRQLIDQSPLRLERIGYFNSFLFPLAVAGRLATKIKGQEHSDLKMPPRAVNAALEKLFACERYLVGRLPLPPGLSLFAVASAT